MKPATRTLTGLAAALFLSVAAVSLARAEGTDLESRVNRIESQTLVELLTRLDRLQNEVQQLRGQIEEQTHTLDGLQQHQKDIYLELDGRLRKLEQGGAASPPAAGNGDNAGTPPPASDGGTTPPLAAGASDNAAVTPPPSAAGAGGGTAVTPPPTAGAGAAGGSADNAQAAYQQAFDLLKKGQYPQAIRGFHDFLGRYPDNALANNAQYWIGEANYVSRDYPAALTEYRKVIDRYPNGSKVPDALLKIGIIHSVQNNWDKARAALTQVKTRYPNSSAARLADERLRKMKQEGH
jgi:tol-pal system protein YbgF